MPTLLDRMRSWLFATPSQPDQRAAVDKAVGQTLQEFMFSGTTRDPNRKRSELKRPLEQHVWMAAAMRVVAQNAVKARLQLWDGEPGKGKLLPEDDPRVVVFRRPNRTMRGNGLIEAIFTYVWEQGYVGLVKQGKARRLGKVNAIPTELWALPGRAFQGTPHPETGEPIEWKVDLGNRTATFQPWEVLWIKRFNPYDPWSGLGMWQAAVLGAGQDFKAARMMDSFIDKDLQLGGVLKLSARSTPEQRTQLEEKVKARHAGPENAGGTIVLGKDQEWVANQATNRDMQYMELRTWNRQEVLAAGGVPPMLVGIVDDYNRATATVAMLTFLQHTLMPACEFVAGEITADLQQTWAGSERIHAAFDFSVFPELAAVTAEEIASARELFNMGVPFNQINERLRLGLKPIESGDEGFLPYTVVPAGLVTGGQTFPVKPQLLDPEDNAELLRPAAAPTEEPTPEEEEPEPAEEDDEEGDEARRLTPGQLRRRALGLERKALLPRWHLYVAQVLLPIERRLAVELRSYFWELKLHCLQLVRDAFARRADEPPKRKLSRSLVDLLLFNERAWADRLEAIVAPLHRQAAESSIEFLAQELPKGLEVMPVGDPKISRFLSEKAIRVRRITANVREQLRVALVSATVEAATIAEAQVAVMAVVQGALPARSLTIARTEAAGAANGARYLELEELSKQPESKVRRHRWVSANDDHVRLSHRQMDGQVVDIGQPFPNGLLYPGELGAPAAEVVNCRCVPVVEFED